MVGCGYWKNVGLDIRPAMMLRLEDVEVVL
jgi:hypothetical protein